MEFASKSKTHFDNSFSISLAEAIASFSELHIWDRIRWLLQSLVFSSIHSEEISMDFVHINKRMAKPISSEKEDCNDFK